MQGKELQVARKRKTRVGRYPKEFRRMAVERLKSCDNIVALSRELGVHRRLLYKWRDQLDPAEIAEESPPQTSRESTLRKEVNQLKRLLAEKAVEVDFFKGALQKIEARWQQSGGSGAKASSLKVINGPEALWYPRRRGSRSLGSTSIELSNLLAENLCGA